MTPTRHPAPRALALPALLAAVVLVLAGCGDAPRTSPDVVASAPPEEPVEVVGAGLVLQDGSVGSRPELCFAVIETYPPQCGGPALEGWDWEAVDGVEEHPGLDAAGARWGDFVVTGTFDGTTLTLTRPAVPLGEASAPEPQPLPAPAAEPWDEARAAEVQQDADRLPGYVGSSVVDGRVVVDVVFDDGTLQDRVDAEHGPGHVAVVSALRPVGPTM